MRFASKCRSRLRRKLAVPPSGLINRNRESGTARITSDQTESVSGVYLPGLFAVPNVR